MKSAFKFLLTALGLALIAIGVGAVLLQNHLEQFVKSRIEDNLSDALSTDVSIDHIATTPLRARMGIHGLVVKNPPDFKDATALECEHVFMTFDPKTIFSKNPVITEMRVTGTDVFYRFDVGKGVNIGKLTQSASQEPAEPAGRTFIVDKLVCEEAEVHFSTNVVPLSRVGISVVNFEIDELNNDDPLSTRRVAALFLKSLLVETVTLKGLLDPIVNPLTDAIESIGD